MIEKSRLFLSFKSWLNWKWYCEPLAAAAAAAADSGVLAPAPQAPAVVVSISEALWKRWVLWPTTLDLIVDKSTPLFKSGLCNASKTELCGDKTLLETAFSSSLFRISSKMPPADSGVWLLLFLLLLASSRSFATTTPGSSAVPAPDVTPCWGLLAAFFAEGDNMADGFVCGGEMLFLSGTRVTDTDRR